MRWSDKQSSTKTNANRKEAHRRQTSCTISELYMSAQITCWLQSCFKIQNCQLRPQSRYKNGQSRYFGTVNHQRSFYNAMITAMGNCTGLRSDSPNLCKAQGFPAHRGGGKKAEVQQFDQRLHSLKCPKLKMQRKKERQAGRHWLRGIQDFQG